MGVALLHRRQVVLSKSQRSLQSVCTLEQTLKQILERISKVPLFNGSTAEDNLLRDKTALQGWEVMVRGSLACLARQQGSLVCLARQRDSLACSDRQMDSLVCLAR